MSITRVQQSQISGSLEPVANLQLGSGLEKQADLASDLNALRTLVLDIKGDGAWYDAATQDLKQVYDAMQASGANAAFQGAISTVGNASVGGTLGVTGAATLSDSLAVAGAASLSDTLSVSGVASFQSAMTGSAGLKLAGDLDVNSSADFAGAVNMQSSLDVAAAASFGSTLDVTGAATLGAALTVTGAADFNGGVTANEIKIDSDAVSHLYLVGASGEIQDSADLRFESSTLFVSGAAEISNGLSVLAGGVEISGDKLEVTGSFAVNGASALDGALSVSGVADFNGGVTANEIKIDGDTAGNLYLVGASGEIADSSGLTYTGAGAMKTFSVTGAADISGASDLHGNVHAYAAMTVDGAASLGDTLSVAGAATMSSTLGVTGLATFSNGIAVNGAAADFNADLTANKISIDSDVAGRLYIVDSDGSIKDEANLTFTGAGALKTLSVTGAFDVSGNAHFMSDLQVDGDLRVKGSMTYIDTQNVRVQDAFIYLATGSAGSTDSGIVLHNGAGAGMDLVIGQDSGAGEVIFGKMDRSPDGDGAMDGINLVASWMKSVRLGSVEGTEVGHVAATAGGDVEVLAAADMSLSANGEAYSLSSAGDLASFEAEFGVGTTLVAALVAAASGGNFRKGALAPTAGQALLDFSDVGTLRAGYDAEKDIDVYLNGVLLIAGASADYSISNDHTVSLNYNFSAGDKVTIVIRNAA